MFECLDVALKFVAELKPFVERIEKRDKDLGRQIRKAASSVPLNLAEGRRRMGKDRIHHFRIAAGSADEVRAALMVAVAWGYVANAQPPLALLDRICAMCWRLTRQFDEAHHFTTKTQERSWVSPTTNAATHVRE